MIPYSVNTKHVFYIVNALGQFVENIGFNYDGFNNLDWKSKTHTSFVGNGG